MPWLTMRRQRRTAGRYWSAASGSTHWAGPQPYGKRLPRARMRAWCYPATCSRCTAATMALAGSIARGATPAEDQALAEKLLRDRKERAEHAVVVGALRDGLAQVSTRVIADAEPRVQKLANVQHLLTPIRAQVSPGVGVLDLVERLHPTPAMGGFPRQPALELIRANEGLDRGWYAGPIGWVNQSGEGEFVVGIRSALVRGDSATLFAGCGIVAESNAAAEYAESEWKLRPMLAALGLGEQR